MKILLVDDSLLDRKLLVRILMKAGVTQEILQAQDGEQAMEVLAGQYADIGLVLLDWQMPKVSGIELMAGMVKIPELSSIPIIMVTASGSEDNKRAAYQVNPKLAGFLAKPYKPEDLMAAIQPFLH
ncbi:MAG: response regulator [Candidatus Omnitrophica bacterium]|nr:response regulator [Candidatus Omnitrophota bacterium]MDE2010405.1 response regulator [Candidatus Omnitrophota bacterium]MDE2214760.1 response regulator [Candidatus Omnitrophota bacterium]MDE2231457.1 response regulator [Candidatus Omnitrophota bacterium]